MSRRYRQESLSVIGIRKKNSSQTPGLEGREKFVKCISDNRQRDRRPRKAGVFLARAEVLSGRERGDTEGMAPGQAWGWGSLQAAPGVGTGSSSTRVGCRIWGDEPRLLLKQA